MLIGSTRSEENKHMFVDDV